MWFLNHYAGRDQGLQKPGQFLHYYYAPKVGMIENDTKIDLIVPFVSINQHTDTKTTLTSANIL